MQVISLPSPLGKVPPKAADAERLVSLIDFRALISLACGLGQVRL